MVRNWFGCDVKPPLVMCESKVQSHNCGVVRIDCKEYRSKTQDERMQATVLRDQSTQLEVQLEHGVIDNDSIQPDLSRLHRAGG